MAVVASASVATLAISAYGAYSADRASSKALSQQEKSMDAQTAIANRQLQMAEEQWDRYKTVYGGVEKQLAAQANEGVKPDFDRVARETAANVTQQFERQRQISDRLDRANGASPDSGNAQARRDASTNTEALARVGALNLARTNEENRADDLTFARRVQALSLGKGLPAEAGSLMNSASSAYGNQAAISGQMAGAYANAAGQAAYGVGRALPEVARNFVGPAQAPAPIVDHSMGSGYVPSGGAITPYNPQVQTFGAEGGPAFAMADGGPVDGPGTGTSDSVPARGPAGERYALSDGEFVIPADVVRAKGEEFFWKLIEKFHRPSKQEQANSAKMADGGKVKVALPRAIEDAIFFTAPSSALRRGY